MQAGISADDIIGCNLRKLTQPLSKGLMSELNCLRKNDNYSWVDFYTWIEKLCGSDCLGRLKFPLADLKKSVLSCPVISSQIRLSVYSESHFSPP
jgi:hypothetical protein